MKVKNLEELESNVSRETQTNPRGIPNAPFVDRVEDYVSSRQEVEGTLKNFQEMISWVISLPPFYFLRLVLFPVIGSCPSSFLASLLHLHFKSGGR